jgi:hypothetical protein
VIDNIGAKNLAKIKETYEKIPGVIVVICACNNKNKN